MWWLVIFFGSRLLGASVTFRKNFRMRSMNSFYEQKYAAKYSDKFEPIHANATSRYQV
jgi:hypothetical protein